MLRVTFEIVSFGQEAWKREIGKLELGLQHVTPEGIGFYESRLYTDDNRYSEKTIDLEHDRSKGAYSLVKEALKLHMGEHNAVADDSTTDS